MLKDQVIRVANMLYDGELDNLGLDINIPSSEEEYQVI